MKYAVSTYSFSRLIESGKMTQLDCISKAKEMGFDGVELVDIANFADGDVLGYAKKLADGAERCDIELSNFAFTADFSVKSEFDNQIQWVKDMIDAAEILGVKTVRHDVLHGLGDYRSFGQLLPVISDACRIIAEYAEKKGIRTMVENHGFICQDSIRTEQLFNAVNHRNFSLLVDIGNFLCADDNPVTAVSRVAPYAAYVHVKDFLLKPGSGADPGEGFFKTRGANYLRGTIVGHGAVPVKQCLDILTNAGYDGYVTVEYEGMEPVLDGIAIGLKNIKNYLQK